jgi:hypothetical protein
MASLSKDGQKSLNQPGRFPYILGHRRLACHETLIYLKRIFRDLCLPIERSDAAVPAPLAGQASGEVMTDQKSAHHRSFVSWIVAAIAGFAGTFFVINHALAFLGVTVSEADGAGLVAGLSIAGLVIVSYKLRAARRS